MNRSKLPKIARWMTTGRWTALSAPDVLQVEPLRHLVIELDRRALPFAADRVGDVEVDLRPVERAVLLVDGVGLAGGVERALQRPFGVIPGRDLAQVLVGPGRELGRELEPEVAVDPLHQPQQRFDLSTRSAPPSRSSAHRPARTGGRGSDRRARRTPRCGAAASARGSAAAGPGSCASRCRTPACARGSSSPSCAISSPSWPWMRNMFSR